MNSGLILEFWSGLERFVLEIFLRNCKGKIKIENFCFRKFLIEKYKKYKIPHKI